MKHQRVSTEVLALQVPTSSPSDLQSTNGVCPQVWVIQIQSTGPKLPLRPQWGEIELEGPNFCRIIGKFVQEGTSGDSSPNPYSPQIWAQACGYTLQMPFEVFMADITFPHWPSGWDNLV